MTIDEIQKRVHEIEKIQDDDEQAHILQDKLYCDFISYITTCDNTIGGMAKEVLKVEEMTFSRWCA